MTDLEICMGTGDYPSGSKLTDDYKGGWHPSKKEIQEMQNKGLVQDSTGSWWDPNNYMDCYSMDW